MTPLAGEMLVICGGGTLKSTEVLLVTPPTVTETGPVVAVVGTMATICVSDQLTTDALIPKKAIVLVPRVAPNPLPLICTCVPTGPLTGLVLFTCGVAA